MEATIETRKRRSKYEKLKYLKFQRSSKRKGTKKDSDSYEETTSSASSTEDEKENEQDAPIETPSNIATVFSIDTLHLYDMITAVAYCVQYIFPEDCSFGIVICDPLHTIRFISDSLLKELMHESVHTVVSMSDILVPKYLQQVFVPDVAALVETKQTMSTLGIDDLYHEHVGRLVVKSKAGHVYELSHKRIVRFNENRLLDGVYMYVYLWGYSVLWIYVLAFSAAPNKKRWITATTVNGQL